MGIAEAPHAQVIAPELTVGGFWRWLVEADVAQPHVAADLVGWAPDICTLTSVLLERSHAFRFVVSPPPEHAWPPGGAAAFDARVTAAAHAWRAAMDDGAVPPDEVVALWQVVLTHLGTPLADLGEGRPWPLCEAVLLLHAIADEACAGMAGGGPAGPGGSVFRAKGRELLTRHSSLSRLPADRVTLLPKGRTTSVGITHRSMSRQVATAWDGIEVVWRRVPMNRAGSRAFARHANMLLLPWPLRIRESDFVPVPDSVRRPEREPFGFFSFAPSDPLDLGLVDRLIDAALEEVDAVEVVVLPEGALDEVQVGELEGLLERRGIPMLVTGLRPEPDAPGRFPGNGVQAGLQLGGTWWHYRQRKHHRWFLDRSQIEAYNIAGALHPAVRWWEAMDVPRRSVQFLDLGGGIVVAAVVCEDLARLDGVAELLRSVGPTLVLTVLLDGPQLASRWTARYASVLADDPGSAVLTLTALGMATRSQPRGQPPSRVIAMWKDPMRGLREIPCAPGAQGVLLKVILDESYRHAADGRTPVPGVTDFHLAGVHQLTADPAGTTAAVPEPPDPAIDLRERWATSGEQPSLDTAELSVLAAWAEALGRAMVDGQAPDHVLGQAHGVGWRAWVGSPEPSPALRHALDLLGEEARACLAGAEHRTAQGLRRALERDAPATPMAGLVRVVLAAGLDAASRG
jgi:hypothetical protein